MENSEYRAARSFVQVAAWGTPGDLKTVVRDAVRRAPHLFSAPHRTAYSSQDAGVNESTT
jgi:hypothetical protein